jgi:hypothetical protein
VSYGSQAAHYGPVINTDDLALFIPYIQKDVFALNNFHPYADTDKIHGKEDLIKERFAAAESSLTTLGIPHYGTFVGEYGFTHEIYDPACIYDASKRISVKTDTPNMEWSRGYGEAEFAQLFNRQTIALLSTPAYAVNPYGVQTHDRLHHQRRRDRGTRVLAFLHSGAL